MFSRGEIKMSKFKNFFNRKIAVNNKNIHENFNFMDKDSCRNFLNNIYIDGKRIETIELKDGTIIKMEDIPEDQIIQRAQEIRGWIIGR
jgi:hypothetical protein